MKLFEGDINWHNQSLQYVRSKRDSAIKSLDEWEELREAASNIKAHTITHLDKYLVEFEKNATKNGIKVHWAKDADEHNNIVESILRKKSAKKILKSKSMLTEECGLNHFLQIRGYNIIDTDLGERIVQLKKEPPSHIVLPAIHLKREEIATIFKQDSHDPIYLTNFAKESLRREFLSADVAITGVNFAIASEGAFVVCTNEGNADLATALCSTHIASMGIEKIVPTLSDLAIFTRILARSATGQTITTYTSHFKKPANKKEIHLIIVDNSRSDILKDNNFMSALKCIRCGACINTCPVYKRVGGHNYNYTIPGPIGANLASHNDIKKHGKLAFASTLCGSCTAVCPLKIDLHNQLLAYRSKYKKVVKESKDIYYKIAFFLFKHPKLFDLLTKFSSILPHSFYKHSWSKKRVAPKLAKKSFKDMWDE